MVIQATSKAIAEVKRLQEKRAAEGKAAQGLRIGIRGGGCTGFSYLFEWADEPPRSTDKVFEFTDGVRIFVDPKSLTYLDGMEMDFVKEGLNEGFKFTNPNQKGECGCGESFTV